MRMDRYLTFKGEGETAFRFHEARVRVKITFMTTYGETPATAV